MGWILRTLLTVILLIAVTALDEDLEFEPDPVGASPIPPISSTAAPVRRQWGIPDAQAVAGKLFLYHIPTDAFSGDVDFFEAVQSRGKSWPAWLDMNKNGVMKGVPSSDDVGVHFLMIRAVGPHAQHSSRDVFAIDVIKPGLDSSIPQSLKRDHCSSGVDPMMLSILMDTEMRDIEPRQRVVIIETFASYFSLPQDLFYLRGLTTPRDLLSLADSTVMMAGPGNVVTTKDKDFASLSFQIGCGRVIRKDMKPVIERIRSDAKDGTLTEVLQIPVIGWHARNELPAFFRDRREVGSGYFYEDQDGEDDYSDQVTVMPTPHPHRHHHGEESDLNIIGGFGGPEQIEPSEVFYQRPSTSLLLNYENILSTPPFIPERPTVTVDVPVSVTPTRVTEIDLTHSSVSPGPATHETHETDRTYHSPGTVPSDGDGNGTELTSDENFDLSPPTQPVSSYGSSSSSSSPSSHPSTHLVDDLTPELITNDVVSHVLNHTSWTTAGTTEEMEPETRNFKPTISHRLKKVVVVAGKVLRFRIPENTFEDVEDGSTSHMELSFSHVEGKQLDNWIMFNQSTLEIIALPLEKHVSKWEFLVTATDKDGDHVSDTLELQIQQHKSTRAVNHEFTLSQTVRKGRGFQRELDWELKTLEALTKVYGDLDTSQITVRAVTFGDPVSFTWTNDSLSKVDCPRDEIEGLMKLISASEDGFPSSALQDALGPNIVVQRVSWQGLENCETKILTQPPPPEGPITNFAPVSRNQIDKVNATTGQLLLFRVPEDTFYDPDDGGTRMLKMSLLNMDRTALDPEYWLQFDSKNQEFYGLPMDSDIRTQEYQLVCEDRGGLAATDGLVVIVRPRIERRYNVEFNIALEVPYETFSKSASLKRKFVEKLQELFGDPNPDAVVIGSINPGSTVITWFNQSLPTDICPEEDIHRLRKVLMNDNEIMSDRLVAVMGSEFSVISVGLEAAGACQGELTVVHKPESPPPPIDESHPIGESEDYLITFVIPAVVIALMLIFAGLVACLFYRKRRASKMGIGDEDERQSFRSKGIPVIFQDELEDKPEPENKNPVIMKEEKPPLPPPEYQRGNEMRGVGSDDAPYHPPPPFPSSRDSGRNNRPKPTPTYRKPPPYVPP